jgi:hypothetical protein
MTRDEEDKAIYAVALVTKGELNKLGPAFERAWPVETTPCFGGLLFAIDEADQRYWREKDQEEAQREAPLEIKVQQT